MRIATRLLAFCLLISLTACKKKSEDEVAISTDSTLIADGEAIFRKDCATCHNFDVDAIGPALGGITDSVSHGWLKKFILEPKLVIESNDQRAAGLYARFKSLMPPFSHYKEDEVEAVIAYLNTKKTVVKITEPDDPNALKNPIPNPISKSGLVGELKLVAQFPPSSEEQPRTRIVKLDHQPNTDKEFMLDQRGILYFLDNGRPRVYLDMAKAMPKFINKPGLATGFGSFAFHPEFSSNGLLYTSHTEPPGSGKSDFAYDDSIRVTLQWVVTEWKTSHPTSMNFNGKSRELLRINMVTGIHGMQELAFDPFAKPGGEDYGLLYIGIGDGGAVEHKYPFLVHSREKLWGTILRIDPAGNNSANGQYGIPKSNPFIAQPGKQTAGEIYAYGFRNPHHLTWLESGGLMSSNIGHANIESYNLIEKGKDYGWPIREGTFVHLEYGNMKLVYPLPEDDKTAGITYPVIQYDHDEGKAMSAGFEYTGSEVPALKGKFLYCDVVNGRLFYSLTKDIAQGKIAETKEWMVTFDGKPTTMEQLCGNARVDLRLGRDHRGELYVFTKPDGKIYKIVNAKE